MSASSSPPAADNPYVVRAALLTDVPALAGLLGELFAIESDYVVHRVRQERGLAMLLGRPADEACVLVADLSGQVVGMVTAQRLVSTAEGDWCAMIEDLVVTAAHRGHGLGPQLLAGVEAWCARQCFERLQLLADRENSAAIEFYTRRQWQSMHLVALRKYVRLSTARA